MPRRCKSLAQRETNNRRWTAYVNARIDSEQAEAYLVTPVSRIPQETYERFYPQAAQEG